MKKTIILAALGLSAAAVSSYGQGFIAMNSYSANTGAGFTTSYFNGASAGLTVPGTFTVELYFALGTVSDPVSEGSLASIMSPVTGLTAIPSSITSYDSSGDGYFGFSPVGGTVTIGSYPAVGGGPISYELVATGPGGFVGRSGAWTESQMNTSANGLFGDYGTAPSFLVAAPIPEPTTLALAGLGGLASLVALRRKKA